MVCVFTMFGEVTDFRIGSYKNFGLFSDREFVCGDVTPLFGFVIQCIVLCKFDGFIL